MVASEENRTEDETPQFAGSYGSLPVLAGGQ